MAGKDDSGLISPQFWRGLVTLCTIVGSSIMGFKYLRTEIKDDIALQVKPLVERVEKLEQSTDVIIATSALVKANTTCINTLTTFLNGRFNKEFVKPDDIIITMSEKPNGR